MLKLAFITLGIVAVAVLLLCVKVLLLPNGKFGSFHIGDSKEMRKRKPNRHAVKERADKE